MSTVTLRILLVDDSPLDRGMVRRQIRKEFVDAEVLEATNEKELAAILEESRFDLVITDFHIRWTDGLKVLRAVKQRLPQCPVLMFTATGSEEIAVEAMKSGLDDYIIKNAKHMVRLGAAMKSALAHSQTRRQVRRLEDQLASLLRNLNVGVFRRTESGRVMEANDAAAVLLGFPNAGELIGFDLCESFPSISAAPCIGELRTSLRHGEAKCVYIQEREVRDHRGVNLLEGTMVDVTERRSAEDEMRRLQDEIAHVARLNTMTEMASGLAHELKQPLYAIGNYATATIADLESNHPDASFAHENLTKICQLTYQSGKTIQSLQDFTRRKPATREPTSLLTLLRHTIEMLSFELRISAINLEWEPSDFDVVLDADAVQVQQVLVNLVSNAIDAMRLADPRSHLLKISASLENQEIRISISDSGTGIPDDRIDELFSPYVSTKPEGSGIGLSISHRIVSAHGGQMNASNNPDQGATFDFTLPLRSSGQSVGQPTALSI